jgi:hypothetical protein
VTYHSQHVRHQSHGHRPDRLLRFSGFVDASSRSDQRVPRRAAVGGGRYLAAQRSGKIPRCFLWRRQRSTSRTPGVAESTRESWKSPLKIDFSRSLLDTTICETFTEVIVTDKSHPYVLGVRLKVASKKIAELETAGDGRRRLAVQPDTYLKYSSAENWGVVPAPRETAVRR